MDRPDSWFYTLNFFVWEWFTKKQWPKISCYCPFKILWILKTPGGKKYIFSSFNMTEVAEGKLEVADIRKNCDCGIAIAEQRFFKSCGIAIAEVLPASCGIALADSKKSCACPPLSITHTRSVTSILGNLCFKIQIFPRVWRFPKYPRFVHKKSNVTIPLSSAVLSKNM